MASLMKALPVEERPRERLLQLGAEAMSNAELLAILLRTGRKGCSAIDLARDLLHHCEGRGGLSYLLELRDVDWRSSFPGIGESKIAQILAALQLGMRVGAHRPQQVDLSNPRAVFAYLAPQMAHLKHEQFFVLLLNAKNHLLSVEPVTKGTLTATVVHPREIFKPAIRRSAHAIILAHNHPSGVPTPSREDREVTQRLIQAGKLIGIEVLDHLVIGHDPDGQNGYYSFRERGLAEFA